MRKLFLLTLATGIALLLLLFHLKVGPGKTGLGPASVAIGSLLLLFTLLSAVSLIAYGTDKKETIIRTWMMAASALLTYAIADLALGYFLIPRLSPPMLKDEIVHHKLTPNSSSLFRSRDYNYIQSVNRFGLRGSTIAELKPPNTYRILMLGDSFTMGKGVGDDLTFASLLEAGSNTSTQANHGKKTQVLNAGVDSYAPILSFLQLKEIAPTFRPDMVILNLDMSDLMQETAYRNIARYAADGQILGVSPYTSKRNSVGGESRENTVWFGQADVDDFSVAARDWVDGNLYITRLILLLAQRSRSNASDVNVDVRGMVNLASFELLRHTLAEDKEDRSEQWRKIFASIANIKSYCDAHQMTFLLTIYPWGHQVNDKEWIPGRENFVANDALISDKSISLIEDFASANSIALFNAFPAFRAYRGERPLYFRYDIHWTPAGHELMARELQRFLPRLHID